MIQNARKYLAFWQHFLEFHENMEFRGCGNNGHGVDHDATVMGLTQIAAQDPAIKNPRTRDMAWIAAGLHSYDRFNLGIEEINLALATLPVGEFSEAELNEIRYAVEHHNQFNGENDSETLICLMDADRAANVGAAVIYRSGQFHPKIPVFPIGKTSSFSIPNRLEGSSYPKPLTGWCDLVGSLEWWYDPKVQIRLNTIRKLTEPDFEFLLLWFSRIHSNCVTAGINEWPLPL